MKINVPGTHLYLLFGGGGALWNAIIPLNARRAVEQRTAICYYNTGVVRRGLRRKNTIRICVVLYYRTHCTTQRVGLINFKTFRRNIRTHMAAHLPFENHP